MQYRRRCLLTKMKLECKIKLSKTKSKITSETYRKEYACRHCQCVWSDDDVWSGNSRSVLVVESADSITHCY